MINKLVINTTIYICYCSSILLSYYIEQYHKLANTNDMIFKLLLLKNIKKKCYNLLDRSKKNGHDFMLVVCDHCEPKKELSLSDNNVCISVCIIYSKVSLWIKTNKLFALNLVQLKLVFVAIWNLKRKMQIKRQFVNFDFYVNYNFTFKGLPNMERKSCTFVCILEIFGPQWWAGIRTEPPNPDFFNRKLFLIFLRTEHPNRFFKRSDPRGEDGLLV